MAVAWDRLPASEPVAGEELEGEKLSFLGEKTPTDTETPPGCTSWVEGLQGSNTKVMVCVTGLGTLKVEVLQLGCTLAELQWVYSEIADEMRGKNLNTANNTS